MPLKGSPAYQRHMLDNAEQQAIERGYDTFPVVDADAHHMEVVKELGPYLDDPWRRVFDSSHRARLIPRDLGDRYVAGRLKRVPHPEIGDERMPGPVRSFKHAAQKMGIACSIVFPTDLLSAGLHPNGEMEVAVARAYARWITERVLPYEPTIKTMLYLPFSDADASLELIERYGETPGVVGFLVTSVRHQPAHHNRYMRLYGTLEERGLPLAFHTLDHWREQPFLLFDNFLAVHALGFPFYNSLHLVNLVLNGIPERFPKLRLIFMEAGVSWLPFLMYRLDTLFLMRPSEAPLLRRKPSEYMTDFYYTTQPLERPDDLVDMEEMFAMIHADTQLLYASDYPHWDFDLPSQVYDLPFLGGPQKRAILGGNAVRLFGLHDVRPVTLPRAAGGAVQTAGV